MEKFKKILFSLLIPVAIGVVIGILLIRFRAAIPAGEATAAVEHESAPSLLGVLLPLAAMLTGMFVGIFIHIIIHEAGHLVTGKLSGYKFVSFRVGTLVIIREGGKLVRKKYGIAGTGGQCLMSPPDVVDAQYKYPFIFYNLGGGLANLLFSVPLLLVSFRASGLMFTVSFIFASTGVLLGLLNLIPLKLSGIANDGLNIIACVKNPLTRRALWIQLKYAGLITQGVRANDMPQEWIEDIGIPTDALTGFLANLRYFYLLGNGEIEQARDYARALVENPGKMLGLHINEMRCELLFFELIRERRPEEVVRLYTPALQKHIKALSTHVSKHRLMYAYHLLYSNYKEKSDKALSNFEKACKHTPFKGEVAGERALVELVKQAAGL